jgi:hypothetical protein
MRQRAKRALLAIVGLALLLGVVHGSASSVSANDFGLSLAVSERTVVAGQPIRFDLKVFRGSRFTADVTPSVSGLPPRSHGTWAHPARNDAVLIVQTTRKSIGTFTLTFTAKGGHRTHKITGLLHVVRRPPVPGFTLTVAPLYLRMPAGTSKSLQMSVWRRQVSTPIQFSVAGLPPKTTATFVPSTTYGMHARLKLSTSLSTPRGFYPVVIIARSHGIKSTRTIHLVVTAGAGKNFRLSGSAHQLLAPGVSAPINVAIANPNHGTLRVTRLTVRVSGTSTPGCSTGNFSVTQFSGSYPITVPANSTRTLSQLGIAQAFRPKITMRDLPVNQDICKNTTITLGYSGAGNGG